MPFDVFWSLLRQSDARGSRSTALGQMLWALALSIGGIVAGPRFGLPSWALVTLATVVVILVVNFVALNWFLAIRNPDALRSERFTLTKLAMQQKKLKGDDLVGFIRAISSDESTDRPAGDLSPPVPPQVREPTTPETSEEHPS